MTAGTVWKLLEMKFPSKNSLESVETYVLLALTFIYGYHTLMLLFGTSHCLSIMLDITTRDLTMDHSFGNNLPCCPGRRSPRRLWYSWKVLCCGAVRWKADLQPTLLRRDDKDSV